MAYTTFLVMHACYDFIGDREEAIKCLNQAEQFAPGRNEHFLHLFSIKESEEKFQEALDIVNHMLSPERRNPFPDYCFLIETRAYHNTSNFLLEAKSRLEKRLNEPVLSSQGVVFDFN